jgi:putative NIF3 family GTP cyclohydrolase 1 type 2
MGIIEQISDFLNPQKVDIPLYRAISELAITKIKGPVFSIRAAKKRGILNFSNSYYYNAINKVGNLFINGELSLEDFLFAIKSNTSITDATYVKREGKKIYGVFKNPKDF